MAESCTVVRFSRDPSLAKIECLKYIDSPDKYAESDQNFGVFYVICIALSIITYVVDILLTSLLLYYYFKSDHGAYFAITLTFLLVPALFMTTISLRWYIVDYDDPSLGRPSLYVWIVRIIFLLLQVAPLLRYIDTLTYGIKSKIAASTSNHTKQQVLYRRMLDEDNNGALLRLFHCFLHAAPQAVIQLMILLRNSAKPESKILDRDIMVLQSWLVLATLISIAWSLTVYHRSVRYSRDDKDKIKYGPTIVAFCWHLMSALSRVLALSLLASIFPAWMGCICALHWGVMSGWLALSQYQTAACSSRCDELLLSVALGLAYVLAFISPKDGPTRYLYLAYYLVCFMENTGALVVWCVTNNSSDNPLLYYGAPGTQVVAFILGIALLMTYYKFCHPSTFDRTKLAEFDSPVDIEKPSHSKSYNVRHNTRICVNNSANLE